ncbi:MAG: efflux RND transporter periplasmic adaptor subunit [Capsulimonadaceae bacterium]
MNKPSFNHLGQKADVVVDAFPKHTFHGKVTKIASGSTIQNGVVTYDVTISIKQVPKYFLRPDMTASATIETGEQDNVLLVPAVALQIGTHGSTISVVTRENGQNVPVISDLLRLLKISGPWSTTTVVKSVPVRTGGTDGTNTEIVSGLTEGETIVEAGANGGGRGFGPMNPYQQKSTSGAGGSGGGGAGGGGR